MDMLSLFCDDSSTCMFVSFMFFLLEGVTVRQQRLEHGLVLSCLMV